MVFLFSVGMYETPLASFWFMYKDKPPKVRFPDLFLHLTKFLKLLTASSEVISCMRFNDCKDIVLVDNV